LVARLSGEELVPIEKPDAPGKPSRPGGNPDFVFVDSEGGRYVVEITRLLRPAVLDLEHHALRDVVAELGPVVPGVYLLEIDYDRWKDGINRDDSTRIRTILGNQLSPGTMPDSLVVLDGIEITKIGDNGSALIPWLDTDDPWDLGPGDPRWNELCADFRTIVAEANRKFTGFRGRRILLLDVALAPIDVELHGLNVGGREPPMLAWLTTGSVDRDNVDEIYLEPGVRVWRNLNDGPSSQVRRRVLTGHRYLNQPRGFYLRLWPPPTRII
jgi:hypothetical protein